MNALLLGLILAAAPMEPAVTAVTEGKGFKTYTVNVPPGSFVVQFNCGTNVKVPEATLTGPGETDVSIHSALVKQPTCFIASSKKVRN